MVVIGDPQGQIAPILYLTDSFIEVIGVGYRQTLISSCEVIIQY